MEILSPCLLKIFLFCGCFKGLRREDALFVCNLRGESSMNLSEVFSEKADWWVCTDTAKTGLVNSAELAGAHSVTYPFILCVLLSESSACAPPASHLLHLLWSTCSSSEQPHTLCWLQCWREHLSSGWGGTAMCVLCVEVKMADFCISLSLPILFLWWITVWFVICMLVSVFLRTVYSF